MGVNKGYIALGAIILLAIVVLWQGVPTAPTGQQVPTPTPTPTTGNVLGADDIFQVSFSPVSPLQKDGDNLVANVIYDSTQSRFEDGSNNSVTNLNATITVTLKKPVTVGSVLPMYIVVDEHSGRTAGGDDKALAAKNEVTNEYVVNITDSNGNPMALKWDKTNINVGESRLSFDKDALASSFTINVQLNQQAGAGFNTGHLYTVRPVLTLYYGELNSNVHTTIGIRLTSIAS